MKIFLLLVSISFALPETIWDDFSSEESSESQEDNSLEVDLKNIMGKKDENGEINRDEALNRCLSIKNSDKISSCVVQLCAKNCQAIHQQGEGVNTKLTSIKIAKRFILRNV